MKNKKLMIVGITAISSIYLYNLGQQHSAAVYETKLVETQNQIQSLDRELRASRGAAYDLDYQVKQLNEKVAMLKDIPDTYNMDVFRVTAYSPYDNVSGIENDGNPDATSTGVKPREGTIAVDPRVIPYGSTIVVIYDDGTIEYGRAEDCGGWVQGNHIDVFRWTYAETTKHGNKKATVLWYKED